MTKIFLMPRVTVNMRLGMDIKRLEEIIRELDNLAKGVNPEQLSQWTRTVEASAKKLCKNSRNKIVFRYQSKKMRLSLEDKKSRDSLVKAIETHFDSMPFFVQGFLSVVKYTLINLEKN